MKKLKKEGEIIVLKDYEGVIKEFLGIHKVDYEIHEENNTSVKVLVKLQEFPSQKAFNLGIKLQRYISDYTKLDITRNE